MNPSRLIISTRSGLSAIVLGLLFVMAACSGGGSNNVSDPPTLVSVQVAAPSINLTVGDSEQLTATGKYSDKSTKDLTASVTWATSPAGLATGISAGTTMITATSGSVSATATLNVTAASATSLAITPNPASMTLFVSRQFTATAQFSDGTSQDVTNVASWSSSSTQTASVTASGVVSAKKVTTTPVTISASFESQSDSAPLTITADNLSTIAISPSDGIAQGTKVLFTATGTF